MTRLLAPALIATALCAMPAAPLSAQALRNHNTDAPVDVDADRVEVQDRSDRATFSGNVNVRQGGLTLDAQRVTVAYRGGVGSGLQVDRLEAAGGVTVRSASETARGRYAIYDVNRRQITMLGGVSLVQGPNNLNGGRLTIDLDSGRATVDGSGSAPVVSGPGGASGPVTGGGGGRVSGRFIVPKRNGPSATPAPASPPTPPRP